MNRQRRKITKGKKLVRVREIGEQHAQVEAYKAAAIVEAKASVEANHKESLGQLERDMKDATKGGMSLHSFVRFQGLRDLHTHAVDVAREEHNQAQVHLDTRRAELLSAVTRKRAADCMLDRMQSREALVLRRTEQKETDEINCGRASRQLIPS